MIKQVDSPADKLKLLREKYAASLPGELEKLDEKWKEFNDNSSDINSLRTLYSNFHKLAGSGATFGFSSLSNIARSLENLIKENVEKETSLERGQFAQINILLESLREAATHPERVDNVMVASRVSSINISLQNQHDGKTIFLLSSDEVFSSGFAKQISAYGYKIIIFSSFAEYKKSHQEKPPIVSVMDIRFLDDEENKNKFTEMNKFYGENIQVIFLSKKGDINTRIKAVRAGALGFYTLPVDTNSLIDKLDSLVVFRETEPYRVLIVDDSRYLSSHYALILQQVGIETRVVINPLEVLEHLENFNPELILMDLHMPGCEGTELANVIRQQEAFVSVPIVYLSGETDVVKQLDALRIGGDEFLTKPIGPVYLLSTVTLRIKRSRVLRSLMVRDSLTGLLNHTRTKEMLVMEMDRARRRKSNMCYAMIDIDNFKTVNDQFGHPVGDQVIKHLSSLLRQRLRKTDVIGRYGGEEFAVILIDVDETESQRILNEIRETFAGISHRANGIDFNVTLSCGIASFPNIEDPGSINDAADKALYKAKNNGRNEVVLFTDL